MAGLNREQRAQTLKTGIGAGAAAQSPPAPMPSTTLARTIHEMEYEPMIVGTTVTGNATTENIKHTISYVESHGRVDLGWWFRRELRRVIEPVYDDHGEVVSSGTA